MADSARFTISELAEAAATTPRTVRFYTAEGLLPPPDSRGRFALYSTEHLDRLNLINKLKSAFQPLNAIRERLQQMSAADVRAILAEAEGRRPHESLDDLLVKSAEIIRARWTESEQRQPARLQDAMSPADAELAVSSAYSRAQTWNRIEIAPGVELNVEEDKLRKIAPVLDQITALIRERTGRPERDPS